MAFTFFFRDIETLSLISDKILPGIKSRKSINIWCAGCASGPEPYTVAMILRENMGPMIFRNVKIYATDIDQSNLFEKIIHEGSYPKEQLRSVPKEFFRKYFSEDTTKPGNFVISEEIRRRIHYQKHNLLSNKAVRNDFDLIICKNVLLHFSREEQINVIRMYHNALVPEGYFITDRMQEMPEEVMHLFKQVVPDARVYRKQ